MSLLESRQLKFQYSLQEPLFEEASFEINPGERIALVGPNGAGKTTLLRVMAGDLAPDAGSIVRRRGLHTAYLPQTPVAGPEETLADWLGEASAGDLNHVLHALGFERADFTTSLARLSAGERSRASLVKCLLAGADLLLLDEPTNHLDLRAREWLEKHLAQFRGSCVVVSHDRRFLENLTTRTFELRRGVFCEYGGGYAFYEREREARRVADRAAFETQQRRFAALQRAAEKRARRARQVEKAPAGIQAGKDHYGRKAGKMLRAARLLRERVVREPPAAKPWVEEPIPALDFSSIAPSGAFPVAVNAVAKSYGGKPVLQQVTFQCRRGERWAVCGPNGSGKTTLFRLLLGLESPDAGEIRVGANVRFGYYAQEAENLDSDRTPVQVCEEASSDRTWIRTLLACLKLPRALADQRIELLSLGERAKTALARVLVEGANVLLLDEPTNHLEIEAQEALEATLRQYPGTILFVSHDRRFVEQLADHALELEEGEAPRIEAPWREGSAER